MKCGLCKVEIKILEFDDHLLQMHAEVKCDICGEIVKGDKQMATHMSNKHANTPDVPACEPTKTPSRAITTTAQVHTLVHDDPACKPTKTPGRNTPATAPVNTLVQDDPVCEPTKTPGRETPATAPVHTLVQNVPACEPTKTPGRDTPTTVHIPSSTQQWQSFLPGQFKKVISKGDQEWIAKCLYNPDGQLKEKLINQNWYYPPPPHLPMNSPPYPSEYFRQRMFLWAPMRMWHIPLRCPTCNYLLSHSGLYPKAREIVDVDSRYYLIGADYPRCSKCKVPICPWSQDIIKQLDPSHRLMFPTVLTKYGALDRKCVTLMKPRTQGNSSSYIHQAIHEMHSEEWGKQCLKYLTDCELHKKGAILTSRSVTEQYQQPPPFRPLPLAQWFETAHTHEIFSHVKEMKSVITSTYGRLLKIDSTKKVTKKLAGDVGETASWMTNIANENGEVLNSVLTTGEGPALYSVCQGIVKRYSDARVPEPEVIYVDRDCCSQTGVPAVLQWFHPWKSHVRLDIFHFMRRFTKGLVSEHHPLFGTFCSKLSSCIFEWDKDDYASLREAKKGELQKNHKGMVPTQKQVTAAITPNELARHCRRQTREADEIKRLIDQLLASLWDHTDTVGVKLINANSMSHVWNVQQKHIKCIQDPSGVDLYTKVGTLTKGGKTLDVLKCARGSSSLESFHKHQCAFIPRWRANAVHTQMYMIEGGSRWNMNRAREAMDMGKTSQTRMYDIRLMSNINTASQRVLGVSLVPEFVPPGNPTEEKVAMEYLLAQSGKGDLRPLVIVDEDIGNALPDFNIEEAYEDATEDNTLCFTEDIEELLATKDFGMSRTSTSHVHMSQCERCGVFLNNGDMVIHMVKHMEDQTVTDAPIFVDMPVSEEGSAEQTISQEETQHVPSVVDVPAATEETKPTSSGETRYDAQGFPGWENVDALAAYLVSLDTESTALSELEAKNILELYSKLHQCDKSPTKYTAKSKKEILPGPWRASRKRDGSTPGVQASERLYMTHGQAAQSPDTNRVSECVCLRLFRKYQHVRNRPKDLAGKTLQVAHAIVWKYSLLQQLISDNPLVREKTNLVLVTINTTTMNSWINKRQKRADREALLKGTDLPSLSVAKTSLRKAVDLPTQPKEPGHDMLTFEEPDNREGQLQRPRKRKALSKSVSASHSFHTQSGSLFSGPHQYPQGISPYSGWPPFAPLRQQVSCMYNPQPQQQPQIILPKSTPQSFPQQAPGCSVSSEPVNRQRLWRERKAAKEDQERLQRGEPPLKRYAKGGQYKCSKCQKAKSSETGHTQIKGKWYCPSFGITVEEWRSQLNLG